MRTRNVGLAAIVALLIAAALAAGGISTATAHRGGCPDRHSVNGAAHANPRSPHGDDEQAAWGCYVAQSHRHPHRHPLPPLRLRRLQL